MNQDTTSAMGMAAQAPTNEEPVSLTGDWAPKPGRIGICCSGGGVRSASFSLGALQALQDEEVLGKADYLASVSGGGYTAAAMTMVADSPGRVFTGGHPLPFAPGSPEERYLRNRSSYLAPGITGKLRLVANLLRGLLLNVLVAGAVLVIGGMSLGWLTSKLDTLSDDAVMWIRSWIPMGLLALIGLGLLYRGTTRARSTRGEDIELRSMRLVGKVAIGMLALCAVGPWTVHLVEDIAARNGWVTDVVNWLYDLVGEKPEDAAPVSTLARLGAVVAALGLPTLLAGAARTVFADAGGVLGRIAVWLVVPLASITVVLIAAVGWVNGVSYPERGVLVGAIVAVLGAFLVADINAGSMHRFYKRRLCTAFALERVWRKSNGDIDRGADQPAGATLDAIERDYDKLVKLSAAMGHDVGRKQRWPQLVLCAAANIGDETVTPPGRNAVTFTFDSKWIGGPQVGYAPTSTYEDVLGKVRGEDVTIPAAMAISGAALSPCMGVMTKRYLRTLLTLVNARLGVWLPSPRWISTHTAADAKRARPTFGWLLREMNGRNKHDADFLYVTDGGHWENLGLVELLRRGCTTIYCIDASGDKEETFFTIGQAISMARSELGVEIDLHPDEMRPDPIDALYSQKDYVLGTYTFTQVPGSPHPVTGRIAFIKAQVTADAPWDVRAYKEDDPAFPNHSLIEQMFADKTFESYRALGYHSARKAVTAMLAPVTLDSVPTPAVPLAMESTSITVTTIRPARTGSQPGQRTAGAG